MTLKHDEIFCIVKAVAGKCLKPRNIDHILCEPTISWVGDEALNITIITKPAAFDRLKEGEARGLLVDIMDGLRDAGEERFPIIYYATTQELATLDNREC